MLKFGTPTIALPLAIKKCTVQTGCTYTEANVITLVPLDTILSMICAFIFSFSCTVWTIMRSLPANYPIVSWLNALL